MKKVCISVFLFFVAICFVWPETQTDQAKATEKNQAFKEFNKERNRTRAQFKKNPDDQYTILSEALKTERKNIRRTVISNYPELKKMTDKAERKALFHQYMTEFLKTDEKEVQTYLTVEFKMTQYLIEKNPKLKELYEKLDPEWRTKMENRVKAYEKAKEPSEKSPETSEK